MCTDINIAIHYHALHAPCTTCSSLQLDEVGLEEKLPLPDDDDSDSSHEASAAAEGDSGRHLYARVVAEGPTRILMISSHRDIGKIIEALKVSQSLYALKHYQSYCMQYLTDITARLVQCRSVC
jgi:DNA-binding NarL/FixJ family response regulator